MKSITGTPVQIQCQSVSPRRCGPSALIPYFTGFGAWRVGIRVGCRLKVRSRPLCRSAACFWPKSQKPNKTETGEAAAADDAAFAFKTGFSARALIGLLGNDDFSFKVSPDGSAFFEAISIDRTSGRPTLPQGTVLGGMASDPAGRADGWIWFNTTAQQLRARAGGVDFNLGPLTGAAFLTVAQNALEASSVISAPGVTPSSILTVSLAPAFDADENSPDLLDLVTLWAEAGTDQITLNATFSDPTSGAVKINWSAN